ncbi:MAG: hypothetical protein ACK55I_48690, partial [bacterium]
MSRAEGFGITQIDDQGALVLKADQVLRGDAGEGVATRADFEHDHEHRSDDRQRDEPRVVCDVFGQLFHCRDYTIWSDARSDNSLDSRFGLGSTA